MYRTNNQEMEKENEMWLLQTKKQVKWLIIIYFILAFLCLFMFQFKLSAILICLLQTGFAFYFYNKSKGLITMDYNPKSAKPSLFFLLLIPTVVLFVVGIMDITILDYSFFWYPFSIILLVFLLVCIKLTRRNETKNRYQVIITSFILGLAFSYGLTINTNEVFSISAGQQYRVQITDKWINEGRNTTYHFLLSPWGGNEYLSSLKVFQHEYAEYQIGDSITIEYNQGLYNLPFIKLPEKKADKSQ